MVMNQQGVYGRVYPAGSLVEDKIMFSLPEFPTMVPQRETYTQGGDSKLVEPWPWVGETMAGIEGGPVAMAHGGGVAVVCGNASTYSMERQSDGSLVPVLQHPGKGAACESAVIGTNGGVHVLGYGTWQILSRSGQVDIAEQRFASTLLETPVARRDQTVMGYYSHKSQVWAAVVKIGATVAQRILVWDMTAGVGGALTAFDLACLAAGEAITAMCELAMDGAEPTMLVGTSAGRVLQYPSGTDDDGTDFAAEWRGYLGQERVAFDQHLDVLRVHCGSGVADNVKVEAIALRTGDELDVDGSALSVQTHTLHKDNRVEKIGVEFDPSLHGNLVRVRIFSENTVSDQWTINDLVSTIDRTDTA
jgi:hypothetical protein